VVVVPADMVGLPAGLEEVVEEASEVSEATCSASPVAGTDICPGIARRDPSATIAVNMAIFPKIARKRCHQTESATNASNQVIFKVIVRIRRFEASRSFTFLDHHLSS